MHSDHIVTDVIALLLDLDHDSLTMGTDITTLGGWDSVNALRVLVYLERELGSPLDYERFMAARTIRDMSLVVSSVQSGLSA